MFRKSLPTGSREKIRPGGYVRGKAMANKKPINYHAPTARPPISRANKPDWLQGWLNGETPDPTVLEQQGFQTHLYYSVVIYRVAGDLIGGTQVSRLRQTQPVRQGHSCPVLMYVATAA